MNHLKGQICIKNTLFEYDFLASWIKYTRLKYRYTQAYLAHGICSTSHLSYFESGKKKLHADLIEALLDKLSLTEIKAIEPIGNIRQKFYTLLYEMECLNKEAAADIYGELQALEPLLSQSPYEMEYRVYCFAYECFSGQKNYAELEDELYLLDKIYESLPNDLKSLYLFASGKIFFKYKGHQEGIQRLLAASELKASPWLNYHIGFSYCFDSNPLKGVYFLEQALHQYEKNGRYINVLWCHNYLGICFSFLKNYDQAQVHFNTALTGAQYFNIVSILGDLYINLSDIYLKFKDYPQSIAYAKKSLEYVKDPLLAVSNLIEAYAALDSKDDIQKLLDTYLTPDYEDSRYYLWVYFLKLYYFHFDEAIFYEETTESILPFYELINYIEFIRSIQIKLIEYLESHRRYKDANLYYKKILEKAIY